jgi:SAM-dependent methyltransferase
MSTHFETNVAVSSDISDSYFENHRVRHTCSDYTAKIKEALLASTRRVHDQHPGVALRGGLRVLSVGCGDGEYDAQCAADMNRKLAEYTGVEPDPAASAAARESAFGLAAMESVKTDVWTGDFDSFVKENGTTRKYDVIYIVHAIHMMPVENTVANAMALLEPGTGVLHIAIQTRKGVPELYETITGQQWQYRTAEYIYESLSRSNISYTVTALDCFIDTPADKVKQLCDFLFFRDTADIIDRVRPIIAAGIKEEHVVINIQAVIPLSVAA